MPARKQAVAPTKRNVDAKLSIKVDGVTRAAITATRDADPGRYRTEADVVRAALAAFLGTPPVVPNLGWRAGMTGYGEPARKRPTATRKGR